MQEIFELLAKNYVVIDTWYTKIFENAARWPGQRAMLEEIAKQLTQTVSTNTKSDITEHHIILSGGQVTIPVDFKTEKRDGADMLIANPYGIPGPEPGVYDGKRWYEYTETQLTTLGKNNPSDALIAKMYQNNLLLWQLYDDDGCGKDCYSADKELLIAIFEPEDGFNNKIFSIGELKKFMDKTSSERASRYLALTEEKKRNENLQIKKIATRIIALYDLKKYFKG
ncbi:MAG: hypothetical protein WC916_07720 [Candidatus Woesearchaeota archaeon]